MLNLAVTNIANVDRTVYIWHRVGKQLNVMKDSTFFPYFYQPTKTGVFNTIDGQKVQKVVCSKPYDVARKRDSESYEADVLFTKRYCIDKIGQFLPAQVKYSFVDIEVLAKELPSIFNPIYPISCISASNSYTEEITTFFIKDYFPESYSERCDDEILLAEKQLLNEFVKWIREQQFDFLAGWNFLQFDYDYLRARYQYIFGVEVADVLSPIHTNRHLGENRLVPTGLGILDYLDMYKKIYRTKVSYALDNIAQDELHEASYEKINFSILSDKIKEKNINDIRRLIAIEKKLKIVDYYDELRRMGKCYWEDLTWNSKILDMMLLSEAKHKGIILPSKHYGEDIDIETTFEGAYRRCDILDEEGKIVQKNTGLYKNLWKLDLGSAYPMAIIEFCLDVQNIKTNEGININGIKFYQNANALLPSLAQKLINKKDELKKQIKATNPETENYQDLKTKYDAIKAVVNSLFGVCGLKVFRLFDYRVASSITFLIRDLLHYVENKLKERNMKVVYIDTDSVFVDAEENPKDLCNALVQEWAKTKYNKDHINIEFDCEGIYEKILIVALCRYKGYLKKSKGIEEEKKGLELKRADSSDYIREFQNTLIEKIMNEETQEDIVKWINAEKDRIKTLPLTHIGFPCKINSAKEYRSVPIFIRALEYTKELVSTFQKNPGDTFYYIYVQPFGTAIRKSSRLKTNKETGIKEIQKSEKEIAKNVLAFDDTEESQNLLER